MFIIFSWDAKFEWWEALILLLLYVTYIVIMKFNKYLLQLLEMVECAWCRYIQCNTGLRIFFSSSPGLYNYIISIHFVRLSI